MGVFNLFDDQQQTISTFTDYVPPDPPSLEGISTLTLDLETNGLHWWRGHRPIGIGLCLPDGSTCYLPFGHKQGRNLGEDAVKRWAQQELRHKVITNISTKFDIHHLREWGVDLEAQGCLVADVAFDAALLDDHREKFSLESLCNDFLPEHERKVHQVEGMQLDPARMAEYASGAVAVRCEADVRQVHLLQQYFAPKIAEEGLSRVQAVENQCIYPVCEMERNSMHLDVETLHAWNKEVERKTQKMLLDVSREVGFAMNPDTTKDWIRLFEKLSIPLVRSKGGEGDPSFTDEILSRIDHPTVQTLRQAGKLMSLRSKYLQSYTKLVEPDGRLHYHLHQLRNDDVGTITGRFSSSEVNIQQVPKTKKQTDTKDYLIRQLFVPPPDRLFFSADAKQIEYRLFAHYANSPRINQAFADNPQLNFHQLIFETLKPYSKTLTYEHTKNINFMRIYGGGIVKLALMMGYITQETAQRLQKERNQWRKQQKRGLPPQPELQSIMEIDTIYNTQLPEVKPLLDRCKTLAEDRGFIRTMLGRRGRFVTEAQKRYAYKSFNVVGQGGGADYMKVKLIELHQARTQTGFVMRATVHDQVLGDVADAESARLVQDLLDRQSFKLRVAILWDMKTGKNWAECD